jgi:hypothetical protein
MKKSLLIFLHALITAALFAQVCEINGELYDARKVRSIQAEMPRDSERLLSQMRSELAAATHSLMHSRIANVDNYLDSRFDYWEQKKRDWQILWGKNEELRKNEEEMFTRIIDSGPERFILSRAVERYDGELMKLVYSYQTRLEESRIAGEIQAAAGSMTLLEFLAPFTVLQTWLSVHKTLGLDTESLLEGDPSLLDRGVKALAGGMALFATTKPIRVARTATGAAAAKTAIKPLTLVAGIGGAVLVEILVDYAFSQGDEFFNRDKLKAQIESAIYAEGYKLLRVLNMWGEIK